MLCRHASNWSETPKYCNTYTIIFLSPLQLSPRSQPNSTDATLLIEPILPSDRPLQPVQPAQQRDEPIVVTVAVLGVSRFTSAAIFAVAFCAYVES